jgi:sulfide:quinone oxidoreductase
MATHHQIVFVGGGNAGLSAVNYALRLNGKLDTALIEPSEKHYYQPAWTLVGGGAFDINDTVRNEAEFISPKTKWIKEKCASFQPDLNQITLGNGEKVTYDYLVVTPGIQLDWHKVKGLAGNVGKNGICSNYSFETAPYTYECVKNLRGGKAIFHNPNTPVKCGGAPHKIMYLASDFWRKNDILDRTQVHYYSGMGAIFAVKKYADTLLQVIDRYGIKTHFFHNMIEINAERKEATFDVYKDGKVVDRIVDSYDMIHVTPPQSAPDFIKNSPLSVKEGPFGWIDVDKFTMQHNRYKNIFSCGDASSLPTSKTGAAIRKQVPAMVKNLLSMIDTGKIGTEQYGGYTSCPLVTGYGKLVLAEFDYNNVPMETFPFDQSKERYSMYFLKKQVLPRLYFGQILHGRAQG